jgi:hypothetical protein
MGHKVMVGTIAARELDAPWLRCQNGKSKLPVTAVYITDGNSKTVVFFYLN